MKSIEIDIQEEKFSHFQNNLKRNDEEISFLNKKRKLFGNDYLIAKQEKLDVKDYSNNCSETDLENVYLEQFNRKIKTASNYEENNLDQQTNSNKNIILNTGNSCKPKVKIEEHIINNNEKSDKKQKRPCKKMELITKNEYDFNELIPNIFYNENSSFISKPGEIKKKYYQLHKFQELDSMNRNNFYEKNHKNDNYFIKCIKNNHHKKENNNKIRIVDTEKINNLSINIECKENTTNSAKLNEENKITEMSNSSNHFSINENDKNLIESKTKDNSININSENILKKTYNKYFCSSNNLECTNSFNNITFSQNKLTNYLEFLNFFEKIFVNFFNSDLTFSKLCKQNLETENHNNINEKVDLESNTEARKQVPTKIDLKLVSDVNNFTNNFTNNFFSINKSSITSENFKNKLKNLDNIIIINGKSKIAPINYKAKEEKEEKSHINNEVSADKIIMNGQLKNNNGTFIIKKGILSLIDYRCPCGQNEIENPLINLKNNLLKNHDNINGDENSEFSDLSLQNIYSNNSLGKNQILPSNEDQEEIEKKKQNKINDEIIKENIYKLNFGENPLDSFQNYYEKAQTYHTKAIYLKNENDKVENKNKILSLVIKMLELAINIQNIPKIKLHSGSVPNSLNIPNENFLNSTDISEFNTSNSLLNNFHLNSQEPNRSSSYKKSSVKQSSENSKKNSFSCEICKEKFDNGQGLGGHMSRKHPNQSEKFRKKKATREIRKEKRDFNETDKKNFFKQHFGGFNYDEMMSSKKGRSDVRNFLKNKKMEFAKYKRKNNKNNNDPINGA